MNEAVVGWLLVHSPLVGAATWAPVASELENRGQVVIVPDLTPALSTGGGHAVRQAELVGGAVEAESVVLVGHSGAGPLLPMIARKLAQRDITVLATIYVDAGLPHPGQSALDVLPPAAVEQLREMTVDGWLPPWTSWWPPEQLEAMLPDEQLRTAMVDSCVRLPFSLFAEKLPDMDTDEPSRSAYIRLSSPYDGYADEAEQRGWVVRRLDGNHLSILATPVEVTDSLQDIAGLVTDLSR